MALCNDPIPESGSLTYSQISTENNVIQNIFSSSRSKKILRFAMLAAPQAEHLVGASGHQVLAGGVEGHRLHGIGGAAAPELRHQLPAGHAVEQHVAAVAGHRQELSDAVEANLNTHSARIMSPLMHSTTLGHYIGLSFAWTLVIL